VSTVSGNSSGASRIGESEGNGEHKNQRHSGADGLTARLRAAARGKIRSVSILRFDCRADVQAALEHLLHEERGKRGDERAAVYSAFAGGGLVGNPVGTHLYDSVGIQQLQGRERCDERGGGVAQAERGAGPKANMRAEDGIRSGCYNKPSRAIRMTLGDYKTVLYRQDDDSWVAEIPAIAGCYALMPTREQALGELQCVFDMIAQEYREKGTLLRQDTTEILHA